MSNVSFCSIDKVYGDGTRALAQFSLDIRHGELMVLVGPSGCGKSTILRLLAGLDQPSRGEIFIDDEEVTNLSPQQRDVAMVFQNYALYPHMSVQRNLEFPLRMLKLPRSEIDKRIQQVAEILGLNEYLGRKPKELSGGQRQRVAMGRAIVRNPRVFLMDEPLSNLDAEMRVRIRADIAALQRSLRVTTLYVTHDQVEAMTLGDRVAVLDHGRLQQVDVPQILYDRPANSFVARFIGSPGMNILPARLSRTAHDIVLNIANSKIKLADAAMDKNRLLENYLEQPIEIGIRPEHIRPADAGDSLSIIEGKVRSIELLGYEYLLSINLNSLAGEGMYLIMRQPGHPDIQTGESIRLQIDMAHLYWFDADGMALDNQHL